MNRAIKTLLVWLVPCLLFLAIFVASGQNGSDTAAFSMKMTLWLADKFAPNADHDMILHIDFLLRQTLRCGLFFGIGLTFSVAVNYTFRRVSYWIMLPFYGTALAAVAYFDEWRKQFIDGRHYTPQEAVVNVLAVLSGCLIATLAFSLTKKLRQRAKKRD